MLSERSKWLQSRSLELYNQKFPTHFLQDYHEAGLRRFADLPHGEKLARAMAYAIENQPVWAYAEDNIGGRIYYNDGPVTEICPELDYMTEARAKFLAEYPEATELMENQLISATAFGHITWNFDLILSLGTEGFKAKVQAALETAKDEEAAEFYNGVLILLDALQDFNDQHIAAYEAVGNTELARRMKKVPRYPCETFEEAVQAFFMQHIVVMRENPFGGNGPGWLDRHLWPYLEKDLAAGRCTLEKAREIIDELFLRLDERLHERDTWVEAVVVGGTNPDGTSAVNPLTYIMVESVIDLNISHPSVYIRVPKDPPDELMKLCARYMTSGNNRAQILNDVSMIDAQMRTGKSFADASNYACGGCMEVAVQGHSSDLLFVGWQNTPKMLELMVTGGVCLRTGKKLNSFHAQKSLTGYDDF
ncbi:MAG: pyruvate formate lyase family protein, partial [Clostridia bacterium]|nr:pyruvate formate lyase family protein [Clostridia bacterium]